MIKRLLAVVMLLLAGSTFAVAELPAPQGRVILEVAGKIGVGNAEDAEGNPVARFDLESLTLLPQTTIETTTEWTKGPQIFEGVLLRDFLRLLEASGENIRVLALNDYESTIPITDADNYDVLLALRRNGEFMRVRDKGPIWIIYPLKELDPHLMSTFNLKMVWQLAKIFVE